MIVKSTTFFGQAAVDIVLTWLETGHECIDCGLPAAFHAVYSDDGNAMRDKREPTREPVCAICAANRAADDCAQIERIEDADV